MSLIEKLSFRRAYEPGAVESALRDRQRGPALAPGQKILVLACDHPARGALGAGSDPMAMASREEVLRRCQQIMAHPGAGGSWGRRTWWKTWPCWDPWKASTCGGR
ncbi:hypothetical protein VRY54_04615 [Actinomyces sp. F1_1611]